jgi:cold shock CspA family protein
MLKEKAMYGEIKKFRRDLGIGVIHAENGRAYRFERTEIRNRREDLEGQEVHFEIGSFKARDIIVLAGSPWAAFGGIGL